VPDMHPAVDVHVTVQVVPPLLDPELLPTLPLDPPGPPLEPPLEPPSKTTTGLPLEPPPEPPLLDPELPLASLLSATMAPPQPDADAAAIPNARHHARPTCIGYLPCL
jgi:hypothetical protein